MADNDDAADDGPAYRRAFGPVLAPVAVPGRGDGDQ